MPEGRFALVVATSAYDDPNLRQLTAPGKDADALAAVLRQPDIGGFKVIQRRNRPSHVVRRDIAAFFSDRDPNDLLLLYFSGHGLKDDRGGLYLAARDTERKLLDATAVSDDFLRAVMRGSRAKRQVLMLDCCFGGAFSRALLAKGDGDVDVNAHFQGSGTVVLTASTAMEFAYESDAVDGEPQLSVFTRMLVKGMRSGEADSDNDRRVSVQDLYDFAYKRIAIPGSKQTPTISSIGQEGTIYVASVPEAALARRAAQQPLAFGEGLGQPGQGPGSRDLSPWTSIRDQGNEGDNAAVAAVVALETSLAVQGTHVSLSARYLYQKAKQLHGVEPGVGSGVPLELIARVLADYSAPLEADWPYVAGEWRLPAGRTWVWLDERATSHRARLFPITAYDEIAFHLGRGRPVLAAFQVHESNWYGDAIRAGAQVRAPWARESLRVSVMLFM